VLFIATANVADTIPAPLLDRMEVIQFDGYTTDEKVAIGRGYLWPRQVERNGLRPDDVTVADDVIRHVVAHYTREAGVRQLERQLGTVLRKTATIVATAEQPAPIVVDTAAVTALLDRLLHHAHVLKCGPRSWRTKVQTDLRTDEGPK